MLKNTQEIGYFIGANSRGDKLSGANFLIYIWILTIFLYFLINISRDLKTTRSPSWTSKRIANSLKFLLTKVCQSRRRWISPQVFLTSMVLYLRVVAYLRVDVGTDDRRVAYRFLYRDPVVRVRDHLLALCCFFSPSLRIVCTRPMIRSNSDFFLLPPLKKEKEGERGWRMFLWHKKPRYKEKPSQHIHCNPST